MITPELARVVGMLCTIAGIALVATVVGEFIFSLINDAWE